jgi:hypothetical protein
MKSYLGASESSPVHKQMYVVNYTETFLSVAKMPSLQVILAMDAQLDWEIYQVDVKSAYLNAKLNKEVYHKES